MADRNYHLLRVRRLVVPLRISSHYKQIPDILFDLRGFLFLNWPTQSIFVVVEFGSGDGKQRGLEGQIEVWE